MKTITIEPYTPIWKEEFKKAYDFYSKLLKGLDVTIEHVGSTSVEGLWAKPILDIDIIVPDNHVCLKVIDKLSSVGYTHVGNQGIEGREVLKYSNDNEHINWMAHHLYVCIDGSESLTNHLLLKKHLRNDKLAVNEYSKLKQELAKRYPNDMDAYVEGKTALITTFLQKEGMDTKALEKIVEINQNNK